MSDAGKNEPRRGLTDAERARMEERRINLLAEADRLRAEARLIVAELAADEVFRRRQPGRPLPGGPCDQGSL